MAVPTRPISEPGGDTKVASPLSGLETGSRVLVAVLANPATPDHGHRTRARVDLAARLIGCDEVLIANLFPTASRSSSDLVDLGRTEEPWLLGRPSIESTLKRADQALVGYGTSHPTGAAGLHHRAQLAWLDLLLARLAVVPWTVGGQARHPSRWQRYTSRQFPGVAFELALQRALSQTGLNRSD